jgi:hypothetical protein
MNICTNDASLFRGGKSVQSAKKQVGCIKAVKLQNKEEGYVYRRNNTRKL